jgi:hypothetical protein
VPSRRPEPRLRASDLIGQNIDDLVGHASDLQSDYVATHHPKARTADTPGAGSDLQRTLDDIARAAREARRPAAKPAEPCEADDAPDTAEEKRIPKIEIYHRTARGRMVRIKGDEDDGENL